MTKPKNRPVNLETRTHGLRSTYQAGCRDDCCKAAERRYRAKYREQQRTDDRPRAGGSHDRHRPPLR